LRQPTTTRWWCGENSTPFKNEREFKMKLQRLFCKNERFKIWIETDEFTLTGSGQT
jgi:hypothetical protein